MSPPILTVEGQVSHSPAEQRVIVHSVSWTTYEHLLADLSNQSSTRLTYDRGTLEILCPLPEHEEWNRTLALLVEVLAEGMHVDVRNFGSTTFRRADLARGFESDSCFYIQHEADISGKAIIDLTVSFVSEAALIRCLAKVRQAVQSGRSGAPIIKTIHGHGYRFVAAVATPDEETRPAQAAASPPRMA